MSPLSMSGSGDGGGALVAVTAASLRVCSNELMLTPDCRGAVWSAACCARVRATSCAGRGAAEPPAVGAAASFAPGTAESPCLARARVTGACGPAAAACKEERERVVWVVYSRKSSASSPKTAPPAWGQLSQCPAPCRPCHQGAARGQARRGCWTGRPAPCWCWCAVLNAGGWVGGDEGQCVQGEEGGECCC